MGYENLSRPADGVVGRQLSVLSAACQVIGNETTRLLFEETKANDDAIEGDDKTSWTVATSRVERGVISRMSSGLRNSKGDAARRGLEYLGFISALRERRRSARGQILRRVRFNMNRFVGEIVSQYLCRCCV